MNETAKMKSDNGRKEALSAVGDTLKNQFDSVKTRVSDVTDRARYYSDELTHTVEQHPIYSILGATAVGFILGAIVTRRH